MKAYYLSSIGIILSIIGIVLWFASNFVKEEIIYLDAINFISTSSILLKIAACLFLLTAFILKIIKSIQSFK